MNFAIILTLFLGLAAAAPGAAAPRDVPSEVKVKGVSLLGTGCPAGTADVQVDATGTLFEATFSAYEVQTGPGTLPSDWRKNCKLTINMEFDSGFQFSILDTDMRGFRDIPVGSSGRCKNTFFFTGEPSVSTTINFPGPLKGDNFDLHSTVGIESWSPCGGSTAILNMNTECSLHPGSIPALIAVDSVSGKLKVIFAVSWRHCHE